MRMEDNRDYHSHLSGRVAAGRRGRGAAGPEVDGLSLADLTAAPASRPPVPTFAEYVPVVAATVTPGTLRAYRPYWKRTVEQWGERRLDEPTPSEVKQLVAYVKANAVPRRNSRGGTHAAENLISALRCLYNRAVDDGQISELSE